MSEDSTMRTYELGNGVSLTYPLGYELEALSILVHFADSSTDPPKQVSIKREFRQDIDGITLSGSKGNG